MEYWIFEFLIRLILTEGDVRVVLSDCAEPWGDQDRKDSSLECKVLIKIIILVVEAMLSENFVGSKSKIYELKKCNVWVTIAQS